MAAATRGSSRACISGNGVPYEACRPGSTTSAHGSRPQRRHRWWAPAGIPGTATVPAPISYGIRWPTKITSISVPGPGSLPPSPGTLTKKSTQRTWPLSASYTVAYPPPPSPVKIVSAAQLTSIMATAASTALPPRSSISAPASAVVR